MDLYGVNFLHHGAPKTWYCVPPQYGYKLEQLAQKLFPDMAETCFNLLRHKAVMIGPDLLRANDIPVNKMVHQQGTIMVVFPHAYHSGFNHGFNIAEALNFALPRWVEYGKRFRGCLCTDQNRDVVINMDQFVQKFQPEAYEKWKRGEDFALHPEDPDFMKVYLEDLKKRVDLGFIKQSKFEVLIEKLKMKREISPWFKEEESDKELQNVSDNKAVNEGDKSDNEENAMNVDGSNSDNESEVNQLYINPFYEEDGLEDEDMEDKGSESEEIEVEPSESNPANVIDIAGEVTLH